MAEETNKNTVKVIVLGDIGRSPRMQYHALSLASCGFKVIIIGYLETAPLPEIRENPNIVISKLNSLKLDKGPKLVHYFAKALWQAISLFLTLFITGRCDYLLCQNPPAIPTLPVCRFYCLLTKTRFVIDWHNYAYSIMAISLSSSHPLLKISKWIEQFFGQSAHSNLCVTYAMKQDLIENWNIVATVLYDRPPKIFRPITILEKHDWFIKIGEQYEQFKDDQSNNKTLLTEMVCNVAEMRKDRPGLLFSSTSWTPDEDFSILMNALQVYDTTYNLTKKLPKLICVITGKGPMKEHYIKEIGLRNWQHVQVITPWLEACDYPTMVASADLGVCLHTSSSGLDLPMKVVDMFGAGIPVFACHFKCIEELVSNGKNGYTFKTSNDLAKQIITWFEDFPNNTHMNKLAETMKNNLERFRETRWEDNWNLRARKFFENYNQTY